MNGVKRSMTLAEGLAPLLKLRDECVRRHGLNLRVPVVLPWAGSGRRVRLLGTSGPYGEVACVNADGHTVAYFDPKQVLEAINAALEQAKPDVVHDEP